MIPSHISPKYQFRIEMSRFRYSIGKKSVDIRNPMGYKRTLRNQMREDAARYLAWQQFVRAEFQRFTSIAKLGAGREFAHPIDLGDRYVRMDVIIAYVNEAHADPDNVWKGIADALIKQDKHAAGSFEFDHLENTHYGWVDVCIWVESEEGSRHGHLGQNSLIRLGRDPCS